MPEQETTNSLPKYNVALKRSILFGLWGADRRYIGDKGLGTTKLVLTLISFGIYGLPWWIADIIIISKHKDDWEQWLTGKQKKREDERLKAERSKVAQAEREQLKKERRAQGLCTACGRDKVQVVANTFSKTKLGASGHTTFGQLLFTAPGTLPTHEKVQTKMMRVCSACGHKEEV
ncbi:MAG TPA: hypothetical protein QF549_03700 [Candidatus Saccharimonadaceae bacterium]|nr:hypothetical protein [Candidatus Saccharimonadaceae bacterium]